MIFSPDFDRSLWLVLACDRKNRKEIVRLISDIPKVIFDRIHEELKKYEDGYTSFGYKKFNKAIRNLDGDTYLYSVEMDGKRINLRLSCWKDSVDKLEENIELSLDALSLEDIDMVDPIRPTSFGYYAYRSIRIFSFLDINKVIAKCYERGYELAESNSFAVAIRSIEEYPFIRIIDLERMSDDIDLSDLSSRKSVNRLIRGRRRD